MTLKKIVDLHFSKTLLTASLYFFILASNIIRCSIFAFCSSYTSSFSTFFHQVYNYYYEVGGWAPPTEFITVVWCRSTYVYVVQP